MVYRNTDTSSLVASSLHREPHSLDTKHLKVIILCKENLINLVTQTGNFKEVHSSPIKLPIRFLSAAFSYTQIRLDFLGTTYITLAFSTPGE